MTKDDFLHNAGSRYREIIESLLCLIEKHDRGLKTEVEPVMGTHMLVLRQKDGFKYAFSVHKDHLSFHNMLMYSYPELHYRLKERIPGGNVRRSCINFKNNGEFPFREFEGMMRLCADYPFPASLKS